MRFDGTRGPKVGVFADCTDTSMPILELAKACEERGFTGLFLNEHPHLPADSSRSQYPAGGPIPERYARFWDPYIALSFVAAQTSLEVGPMVSLIGEHDPIALAKAIATLDVLSEGRLIVGAGWGWHREEFEAARGLPANRRAQVLGETLALMTELWTQEVASYDGEFLRLKPSMSWPKPHQQPRPPVLLGVPASEKNFVRIAQWADGWVPMGRPLFDPEFPRHLDAVAEQWEAHGRTEPFRLSTFFTCFARGAGKTPDTVTLTPDRAAAAIERAQKFGAERIMVALGLREADEVLRGLDVISASLEAALR